MAMNCGISFESRERCLKDLAESLGRYMPCQPKPAWWDDFEKWFLEGRKWAEDIADAEGVDPTEVEQLVRCEIPYPDWGNEEDDDLYSRFIQPEDDDPEPNCFVVDPDD